MYSFPNLEPVCCSMSGSNCCFLTWIQVSQGVGKVVWYPHLFTNCPHFVVIHNIKGYSILNEEVDVSLEFSCFFYDPANVGNLISGSSAFSKRSLKHLEVLSSLMLRPSLEDFEHYLTSMVDECSCPVVWTLFSTALLGNWDEDWPFAVLWPLLGFPNLLAYWVQHFNGIIF